MTTTEEARAQFAETKLHQRKAKEALAAARRNLIDALAADLDLDVGSEITVGSRRAFVSRFTLDGPWREEPERLAVYYKKAKLDGSPYLDAMAYPTPRFTPGWAEATTANDVAKVTK